MSSSSSPFLLRHQNWLVLLLLLSCFTMAYSLPPSPASQNTIEPQKRFSSLFLPLLLFFFFWRTFQYSVVVGLPHFTALSSLAPHLRHDTERIRKKEGKGINEDVETDGKRCAIKFAKRINKLLLIQYVLINRFSPFLGRSVRMGRQKTKLGFLHFSRGESHPNPPGGRSGKNSRRHSQCNKNRGMSLFRSYSWPAPPTVTCAHY